MEELIYYTIRDAIINADIGIKEVVIYNQQDTDSKRSYSHQFPLLTVDFVNTISAQMGRYLTRNDYSIAVKVMYHDYTENMLGVIALKNKVINVINYLSDVTANDGLGWGGELLITGEYPQNNFDGLYVYTINLKSTAYIKYCPLLRSTLNEQEATITVDYDRQDIIIQQIGD